MKKKQDPNDPGHITDPFAAIGLGIAARAQANRELKQDFDIGVRPEEKKIVRGAVRSRNPHNN